MNSLQKSLLNLLVLVVCSTVAVFQAAAQVTATKFYIIYNATNCNYEAHMIVTGGSASGNPTAGASQFSIVVPHNTVIAKVADNQPRTTISSLVTPSTWNFPQSRVNAPSVTPGVDYIAATLTLSPTGAYPALPTNTDLVLFTFTAVTPTVSCGAGIRIWNNNSEDGNADPLGSPDPTSNSGGMLGGDFNNSFTVGSTTETYSGRSTLSSGALPSPTINPNPLKTIIRLPPPAPGSFLVRPTSVAIGGANCVPNNNLTYVWRDPTNTIIRTTVIPGVNPPDSLVIPIPSFNITCCYTLTLTNSNMCSTTAQIQRNLPINFVSFTANANGCVAQLNWQIAPGQNDLQRFDVQYSNDGSRFVTVGQVERNPYNDYYHFVYTQPNGKGYYRLKVIDLGGKATYSETMPVSTTCDNADIIIAPNPTSSISIVSGIEAGDQVKVTDVLGNVIANYISGGTTATVDVSIYPAGIYSVIVSRNGDILKAAKLTKQ